MHRAFGWVTVYTPVASNASVTLSLLEQLNIALIQAAERSE